MGSKVRLLSAIILMIMGIAVMAYPKLSHYINTIHSSRAVQELSRRMEQTDSEVLLKQRAMAQAYNAALSGGEADILEQYGRILEFGNGVMGSISIPKIGVELSIYHGVSDGVLRKGAGHVPQSALPIGGTGNHCVLSGHTGLPDAELFTGLTQLQTGDAFYLHVLDETLGYEVDQISVVLPHEVESLIAVAGRDYCTLVTCTPYGINSHRLLVRGERIVGEIPAESAEEAAPGEIRVPFPGELILAGAAVMALAVSALVILLRQESGKEGKT